MIIKNHLIIDNNIMFIYNLSQGWADHDWTLNHDYKKIKIKIKK